AFATVQDSCSLATHGPERRGVLLLDPLDIHWTAIYPVQDAVSQHMKEQYKLLNRWPEIAIEPIHVNVYMPAGRQQAGDPPAFVPFQLQVAELLPEDWGLLSGVDLFSDPARIVFWCL